MPSPMSITQFSRPRLELTRLTFLLEPRLNWVMDIGEGMAMLKEVLAQYNFKNLNELFPSENTTTEFMCK